MRFMTLFSYFGLGPWAGNMTTPPPVFSAGCFFSPGRHAHCFCPGIDLLGFGRFCVMLLPSVPALLLCRCWTSRMLLPFCIELSTSLSHRLVRGCPKVALWRGLVSFGRKCTHVALLVWSPSLRRCLYCNAIAFPSMVASFPPPLTTAELPAFPVLGA